MSCIIVLGPHRSGTSLVAGIMRLLGVNMGEMFRQGDEFNPIGYHEDLEFKDLNHSILKFHGYTWWKPPQLENYAFGHSVFEYSDAPQQVKMLMGRKIAMNKHKSWGWKDPRQILLMPVYEPSLQKYTKYVVVSREVKNIAASVYWREVEKQRRVPPDYSTQYWIDLTQDYYSRIMEYVAGKDYMIISYEQLTSVVYAEAIVRDLALYCGLVTYLGETSVLDNQVSQALGMIKYANKL